MEKLKKGDYNIEKWLRVKKKVNPAVDKGFRMITGKPGTPGILIEVLAIFAPALVKKPEVDCRVIIKRQQNARPIPTPKKN